MKTALTPVQRKWNWDNNKSPNCVAPSAGNVVKFLPASTPPAGSYVTFVSGLSVVSVKGTIVGNEISAAVSRIQTDSSANFG